MAQETTPTQNEEVEQFIEAFHARLEDLQDADEAPDTPSSVPPITTSHFIHTTEHHVLSLKVPIPLWDILQNHCPRRGISNFILQATHEKLQREK